MLKQLIGSIRERLAEGAYVNEAAISHGVVTPVLNALGWDSADPKQLVPEFANARGRVDFALIGLGKRPAVFVEVKAVGKARDGDRQLFEYAFHEGVPLCVLTDGREWSFYLPSGQGTYEERRVYLLQLDERPVDTCAEMLTRYLSRQRVRDQSAFEDAQRELKTAASRREAIATVPRAWADLLASPEDTMIETIAERTEVLCGFKPEPADVLAYLRRLQAGNANSGAPVQRRSAQPLAAQASQPAPAELTATPDDDLSVTFTLFGVEHRCANASRAMQTVLGVIAEREPERLPELAERVRTPTRNWVATRPDDIIPGNAKLSKGL